MQAKRLPLAAGVVTAFEFDAFYTRSVIVKNMTGGAIHFCDGPFDVTKSAIIPAFGWQTFTVTVPYGEKPKFHVKADVAGDVEIDFGSGGMGFTSNTFDLAGMIPHTLTLTQGEDTTLTVELTRLHGQTLDLDNAVSMVSGATVFNGDVIKITAPTATAEHYAKLKINGVNYGRLESDMTLVISGETTIETEAVALDAKTVNLTAGAGTTLTAAQTRLAGMLTDLSSPDEVLTGGTVYVGDTVEFTATTEQGAGYHVTLTIDGELADLDGSGKVSVVVADDIAAESASVPDEEG